MTKKHSCGSKIPQPPHNFSNGPSLSDIPWDTAYTFDDVNDIWCHWESLLKQAIDHHTPLKRVNLKSNHLPWINLAIQKQMRIRNLLYKKFHRIPTNENWNKYRCQRNKVTRKDSQLKISVLMQRLFLLDARLVYSGKN